MNTIVVTAQVDADGVLNVKLPLSPDDANKTVRVTVEPAEADRPKTREAWLQFLAQTGGSITDPTFVRHPEGELEERDWMP